MEWMIGVVAVAVFAVLYAVRSRLHRGAAGSKRCSRCWRPVDRLRPYQDGRREYWICDMCAAEMDFANASRVPLPRR